MFSQSSWVKDSQTYSPNEYYSIVCLFNSSIDLMCLKMRPLSMIQQVLVWLCMHPFREKMNKWKKCACVAFSLFGFIVNLCTVISSVAFFLKIFSVNFEESSYTLMQICPFISVVNVIIAAFFLRNRIGEIFEKLFNIYATSKCLFDHEYMNVLQQNYFF